MIDANKAFLAMSLYNIAHAFLFQNKVAEALKEFESAVHHDPGFAAALYNIGILKFNGGDCAGAILALERAGACATEPDLVAAVAEALNRARTAEAGAEPLVSRVVPAFLLDVMRSRADLHVAKGEGDAARDLLSAVVTLRPTDGKAWTLLGQALHHCGQIDLALAALDQGIACPGNEVHGTIRKGDVLFLLGRMAEAEACQRRALALAPDDGLAWEGLGHALYHQGKFVESAAAFERSAALRPEDGRLHCYLGSALMAQKQADAAERAYRRGTELNPHHGESWEGLGHVYGWLQRYDDAVAAFSRALECDPESARFRVYIAGSLRLLGDGRAAEAMIREALARDDTLADGWEVLGHTLMDCGRVAEAATAFGKACHFRSDAEKLSHYGAALARLGQYAEAVDVLRQAAALPCDDAARCAFLGKFLALCGRQDESQAQFLRAIELDRSAAEPWLRQLHLYVLAERAREKRRLETLAQTDPSAVVPAFTQLATPFGGHYHDWRRKRITLMIEHYGADWFRGKRVLELGCGYGDIGMVFDMLGAEVTFVDGRGEHLEEIRRRYPSLPAERLVTIDLDRDYPALGRFDVVLHLGLLYHIKHHARSLAWATGLTDHLVLETEVCDFQDAEAAVSRWEQGYDQALGGRADVPSAAGIEAELTSMGFAYTRHDDARLNSAQHRYDWTSGDTGWVDEGRRRFWFCARKAL